MKPAKKVNPNIQDLIAKKVLEANEEREPSGRLSASRLGWPLQWQMLHYHKVPQKPIDEYTLRKFQRGKDVEDRIVDWLAPSEDKKQVPVNYKGVVGFADVVLEYPVEIKSTTNAAFKRKQKHGASRSHRLQGELYAKALGFEQYAIAYVASDDYRVLTFEFDVTDETDTVIAEYEKQKELEAVPVFEAKEAWHATPAYNPYPDWMKLNEEQIATKLASMGIQTQKTLSLD